ncbi:MAG: hypothetical protein ACYDEQ_08595 [Desulfocucumaceae bacterium]
MGKLKILALAAILSLVCLTSAYAIPDCMCCGGVYYGGTQLWTFSVTSYSSPVNQTTYYTPSTSYMPTFYFGHSTWATGTYYICIQDPSGHWYHATINHTYSNYINLGDITLSSIAHPQHRESNE